MFVNTVISRVRSVDDSIACSCLHSVTQRAQNTVFSAGQRVSFTAFYRFRLRMGRRFKGGEASEDLFGTPDKMFKRQGWDQTRKRTYTVHNVVVGVGSREEVCISTLIFNFLSQYARPARQAGHRSLLQITFVVKSSKKNFLSLESKEEIFLIIFIFSSGKSCHIFG